MRDPGGGDTEPYGVEPGQHPTLPWTARIAEIDAAQPDPHPVAVPLPATDLHDPQRQRAQAVAVVLLGHLHHRANPQRWPAGQSHLPLLSGEGRAHGTATGPQGDCGHRRGTCRAAGVRPPRHGPVRAGSTRHRSTTGSGHDGHATPITGYAPSAFGGRQKGSRSPGASSVTAPFDSFRTGSGRGRQTAPPRSLFFGDCDAAITARTSSMHAWRRSCKLAFSGFLADSWVAAKEATW